MTENTNTRRVGRPQVGPKVEVRITAETLELIDQEAEREGLTRAKWLRFAIEDAVAPMDEDNHADRAWGARQHRVTWNEAVHTGGHWSFVDDPLRPEPGGHFTLKQLAAQGVLKIA